MSYSNMTDYQKRQRLLATAKWQKKSIRQIKLAFNLTNDHDIIARLDNVDNKTDYVRRLIRTDIAKETEE